MATISVLWECGEKLGKGLRVGRVSEGLGCKLGKRRGGGQGTFYV